ncbi:macro domain-containing protein [Lactococcus petauri]|uniref:macro domain-containing protein n=1 Tax=Lactococcus petauri TaxID=1940789 RepID=UPI0025507E00|nr:macro domain-containing protein [Lactococcus petauri]
MVFIFKTGDILSSSSQAIVNTVNCEGYLGKGLAYQFKTKYPEMEESYKEACESGTLKPGRLHFYQAEDRLIINFPTKDKWRANSKMEYIQKGLVTLAGEIVNKNLKTIAIPPLGSGNGGLNWHDVKNEIKKYLYKISLDVDIEVYEPTDSGVSNEKEKISNYITLCILSASQKLVKINQFNTINLEEVIDLIRLLTYGELSITNTQNEYDKIAQLKRHYNEKDLSKLHSLIRQKIISSYIEQAENQFEPVVVKAVSIMEAFERDEIPKVKKALILASKKDNSLLKKEIPKDILDKLLLLSVLKQDLFGNIKILDEY